MSHNTYMLYTKKGDKGTTKLFDCPQGTRISKSAPVFEALGMIDELNSSLGYARALSRKSGAIITLDGEKVLYEKIIQDLQQHLFCIQAELGGSDMHATEEQLSFVEKIIYEIETLLPPITSFIVPGGTETGAYLDLVRTIARRAERAIVIVHEKHERTISDTSIAYLNRLSSILYALARFANYQEGYYERKPTYT